MSEIAAITSTTDAQGDGDPPKAATAGGLLRDARVAAGIHIGALAVALKVPVSKIEALESNNFSGLPDTVFVRALAASMCRTLKIDASPVLALLPASASPRLSANDAGLNAPMRSGGSKAFVLPSAGAKSRSLTVLVLALLAGALMLLLLPRMQSQEEATSIMVPLEEAAMKVVNAGEPSSGQPVVPGPSLSASSSNGVGGLSEPVIAKSVEPLVASASPASVAESVVLTSAASAPLILRARGESWVQVRDGSGAIALEKKMSSGESVSVSGIFPLAVVVGRADMTDVFVRGKAFELGAVSRDNVARFEVK